ncbi:MAG: phenylalanine--tRNA ligase subunit beta [Phycisphaeraceae bacterium]|nr:phenylalanine--tRNA ligase subunit beta [Phycisphaeraceae bacterium]
MNISLRWINDLLSPGNVTPDELEHVLTGAGFPLESAESLPDGDTLFDVEITSNRGDCFSHLGLAREIAASTMASEARVLKPISQQASPRVARDAFPWSLENRVPQLCPRFTAQIIRGVTVGPSPRWLVERLEAVGQRSINNVVDVTNFLLLGLGQPAHVFDLDTLAGQRLVIRHANEGEPLTTLDGERRKLKSCELVVADGTRAQSLAGVIGGLDSAVTASTRNVVLELACWDPVTIRAVARRLNIRTDSSVRFERGVDPRTIDEPAIAGAAMIAQLTGGECLDVWLDQGRPSEPLRVVSLRPSRCARILGYQIDSMECAGLLVRLGIAVAHSFEDRIDCTIPAARGDLEREIDLIEEVGRVKGLDAVPVHERVSTRIASPQSSERARALASSLLTGLGFYEAVTFSFTSPGRATAFLPARAEVIAVDDQRRKEEPSLRPSVIIGLLACRRANQDAQARQPGGVRLFERAPTYWEDARAGGSVEGRRLALLADVDGSGSKRSLEDRQRAVRVIRGAVECLLRNLGGDGVSLEVEPCDPPAPAWRVGATARVYATCATTKVPLGVMGEIAPETLAQYDISVPQAAAELDADALEGLFPPAPGLIDLPTFPPIERDLSLLLAESTPWADVIRRIEDAGGTRLERTDHVTTYRGKQVPAGRKSVTVRLTFRDRDRTLRHEEVDEQVARVVEALRSGLGAEIRVT